MLDTVCLACVNLSCAVLGLSQVRRFVRLFDEQLKACKSFTTHCTEFEMAWLLHTVWEYRAVVCIGDLEAQGGICICCWHSHYFGDMIIDVKQRRNGFVRCCAGFFTLRGLIEGVT